MSLFCEHSRLPLCLIVHALHCTWRELPLIARAFASLMLVSENKACQEKMRRREGQRKEGKEGKRK